MSKRKVSAVSYTHLFGAGNYQASVKSLDTNNNLYTAASYITTKFRQHDIPGMTSLTELQGTQAVSYTHLNSDVFINNIMYMGTVSVMNCQYAT